ncbi:zinc finger protein 33B [Pieris rapae]|uniref:zinc finger protein 33B n=1 Tax=Pieris rapae TaxID=64459 RepID=UPI001E27E11E|nr:zinc finger protein 33B [Pieris rapae]
MCFKESNDLINIYENCIYTASPCQSIRLASVIKDIFPIQKIFLQQACQYCIELILNIYTHLRRKKYIEGMLLNIIQHISIKLNSHSSLNNLHVKVELPAEKCNLHEENSNKENLNVNAIEDANSQELIFNTAENIYPMCFKVLKGDLKLHLRGHRKINRKLYTCDVCEYTTKCKTTLEGHINSKHLKSRPYICFCSKKFYTKSALAEHNKTHTHKKDIICEICGETFYYNKSLNNHLKLHSNDKTFECLVCNQRFVNKSRVNYHMKRKHGEKREICYVCGKKFVLQKELIRHKKLVHKYCDVVLNNQELFLDSLPR